MNTKELVNFVFSNTYSFMSPDRLQFLAEISCEETLPPGAIVECGVCNGGSLAVLAHGNNREVWGFDSWEGCPEPGPYDSGAYESVHPVEGICKGNFEKVNDLLFNKCAYPRKRIHLVKGWIENTIPDYLKDIQSIALLHIDVDYYYPTRTVLNLLYENIVLGGMVFCGDYGYWLGANLAIHQFACHHPITLERPFKNGVFWRKEKWRNP